MPEHTPPPWLAHDELPRGYPSPGTYMRSDGGFVTLTEADYSYARRCVNAHDALVEACRQTKDDLATLVGWYAGDLCNAEHAAESKRRIAERGMLHFLASANERMLTALALAITEETG